VRNKLTKALATTTLLLTQASPAFAQDDAGKVDIGRVTTGFSITDIGVFIAALVQLLFAIAGVLVFAYLIWGGIQWITSGGDKTATQAARDRITAALVGLAIIAIAYALTRLLGAFFGINFTSFNITKPY
jgi:hypothetical protein